MVTLIVEDDTIQLNGIEAILKDAFPDMVFLKATDYDTAADIINTGQIDLFLLDIELNKAMDSKTGIDLGAYIRSLSKHQATPILFLTALASEAAQAIHVTNCFDYLVKPYKNTDLTDSVRKLLNSSFMPENPLDLKGIDGAFFRTMPSDICYIHSKGRIMHIYCVNRHHTTAHYRMKELLALLPVYFKRCHKSYIINIKHVDCYDKPTAIICIGNTQIPVGKKYERIINKEFHT